MIHNWHLFVIAFLTTQSIMFGQGLVAPADDPLARFGLIGTLAGVAAGAITVQYRENREKDKVQRELTEKIATLTERTIASNERMVEAFRELKELKVRSNQEMANAIHHVEKLLEK
jgi:hypothetical protein